jgi:ABC-type amino acid transport substrate-binding protein
LEELAPETPKKVIRARLVPVPAQQSLPAEPSKLTRENIRNMTWTKESQSSPGKFYTVKYSNYAGQLVLTCDCPSWIYNHRHNRTCKHTDEVEAEGYPNPFQ